MLHLKAFGGLAVDIDGIPGTGAGQQRKTLALLALLAASRQRGLSRDKLIAALWPETDAEHGRALLHWRWPRRWFTSGATIAPWHAHRSTPPAPSSKTGSAASQ